MNQTFAQLALALTISLVIPAVSMAAPLHGLDKVEVKTHNLTVKVKVDSLKQTRAPLIKDIRSLKADNASLRADFKAGSIDRATYRAAHAKNIAKIADIRVDVKPLTLNIRTLNKLRVRGRDTNIVATAKIAQFLQDCKTVIVAQAPQFTFSSQTAQITGAASRVVGNSVPAFRGNVRINTPANRAIAAGNGPTLLSMIESGDTFENQHLTIDIAEGISVDVPVDATLARNVASGDVEALQRNIFSKIVNLSNETQANKVTFDNQVVILHHG